MNYLTHEEHAKIKEITNRLEKMYSPVLRLQAILQFSQIVDILSLGDTSQVERVARQVYEKDLNEQIYGLEERLDEYEEQQAQAIGSEGTPATPPTQSVAVAASSPDVRDGSDVVA